MQFAILVQVHAVELHNTFSMACAQPALGILLAATGTYNKLPSLHTVVKRSTAMQMVCVFSQDEVACDGAP